MDNLLVRFLKRTYCYSIYKKHNLKKLAIENEIRRQYFLNDAEEMLRVLVSVLNEGDVNYWLDYGTLLGCYREGDFIKHDNDLDIGALITDAPKIKDLLTSNGFELVLKFRSTDGGMEECYRYNHTCVDVFYYREDHTTQTLYCTSYIVRRHLFASLRKELSCWVQKVSFPLMELKTTRFKGIDVNIPEYTESYLKAHYGEHFMTPDPSYDSAHDAHNITNYKYKDVKGTMVKYSSKY